MIHGGRMSELLREEWSSMTRQLKSRLTAGNQNWFQGSFKVVPLILVSLLLASFVVAFNSNWTQLLQQKWENRSWLKLSSDLAQLQFVNPDFGAFIVVKKLEEKYIHIQVFHWDEQNARPRLESDIATEFKKEAYLDFRGQAKNLIVTDIDGDGVEEIIAPVFDSNLVGRVVVLKMNKVSRKYERASSFELAL